MDQTVVASRRPVHLPVASPGGLLYVGDVHAAQGDGELSRRGARDPRPRSAAVDLVPRRARRAGRGSRPRDRLMVLTAGARLRGRPARGRRRDGHARSEAQLGLEPAEAMALLSLAGDLRIGQAFGGGDMTLRLEVPPRSGSAL